MKFQFWSIGRPHDEYVKKGIEEFCKRIKNYYPVEWIIVPASKNAASLPEAELKKQEGKLVLSKLNKEDLLVLLDENGVQLSSVELAQFISQKTI